jgi:tRNA G10  N-methylase Trm11
MTARKRSDSGSEPQFGVLVFAGLARIAEKELSACSPGDVQRLRLRNYDLLLFRAAVSDLGDFARLRLPEDCFYMMGDPVVIERKSDAARLRGVLSQDAILRALEFKNQLFHPKKPKGTTYNCFVKQDKDRNVHRQFIADHVCALVAGQFSRWKRGDPASVEFWGFYLDLKLLLGLRLSDNRMRYRGREPAQREGALRPTVAAALACVADPQPGELVVDPMCGTGTLLQEAIFRNDAATYVGGDIDAEAVQTCKARLADTSAQVRQWDATDLPFPEQSIDCILCNLPFGKQYSTTGDNEILYPRLISAWAGKMKPGGRMVLLTSDWQNLENGLTRCGLSHRVACEVKILGEWARVYKVWG